MTQPGPDLRRRRFLAGAAAFCGGLTVAPGVTLLQAQTAGAAQQVRWGLLIDTNRCDPDCDACIQACHEEHRITHHERPRTDPQWIRKVTLRDPETGWQASAPVMCQHCERPPCADVCPTGATFKRPDGIVMVNRHTCIGCRYCLMACPYGARQFVHEKVTEQRPDSPRGKGTAEGCNLCVHRIDAGNPEPACVEACRERGNRAIVFGNLNDPQSGISRALEAHGGTRLRADLRLNPAVRYQGV